jgi:hypothetical protein
MYFQRKTECHINPVKLKSTPTTSMGAEPKEEENN